MSFPPQPTSECELCHHSHDSVRMGLCRVGEVVNGEVLFRRREVCPACVSKFGVLLPTTALQSMTEDAISRTHKAVVRTLIHEGVINATAAKQAGHTP